MKILKGHDHVIESVCFGKKPPTATVPVALAAVASLNILDTSQKSGVTDDTSLVDTIGVNKHKHLHISYCLLLIAFERGALCFTFYV